tara:strand:- start:2765 stop:2920 length:156 start_codon:yes stop_codon:yes gene_type:complete
MGIFGVVLEMQETILNGYHDVLEEVGLQLAAGLSGEICCSRELVKVGMYGK